MHSIKHKVHSLHFRTKYPVPIQINVNYPNLSIDKRIVVVCCPFGVGEMRDGVVVVVEDEPPLTSDSPSSESSLSYSTASLP